MGILYDWWPCETWRCCVNKQCSTSSISRHWPQHAHIFICYTLCAARTDSPTHPLTVPSLHKHRNTHTGPRCLCRARGRTCPFGSSTHSCRLAASTLLFTVWDNNETGSTEHEGIEFFFLVSLHNSYIKPEACLLTISYIMWEAFLIFLFFFLILAFFFVNIIQYWRGIGAYWRWKMT